mmetsp:Transcript_42549/g.97542  ORF Transcript_42549/g.97542 Transcript_42549/m.97542 type:complete len:176 (-) Transcript_42549:70-597(-)
MGGCSSHGKPSSEPRCETYVPAKVQHFTVKTQRSVGQKLGIDVMKDQDKPSYLLIYNIVPGGCLSDWMQGDQRIHRGDRVSSVNGMDGNTHKMLQTLSSSLKLEVVIMRNTAEVWEPLPADTEVVRLSSRAATEANPETPPRLSSRSATSQLHEVVAEYCKSKGIEVTDLGLLQL